MESLSHSPLDRQAHLQWPPPTLHPLIVSTSSQWVYSGIKPLAHRPFGNIQQSIKSHNDLENEELVTNKAGLMPISWNLKSSQQT